MFYTAFIERDNSSHIITNDSKGFIAKDLTFLRKLDGLLKDTEVSRKLYQSSASQNLNFSCSS